MNSNQPEFDWHQPGLWLMVGPDGEPILETANRTPWGCRSIAITMINRRWSRLKEDGFVVQSYKPELTPSLRTGQDVVTSNETYYRYPAAGPEHKAPSGDLFLLTTGGITVPGAWTDDGRYFGWHPKVQRNKELEIQLGYRSSPTKEEAHEPASSEV